MPPTPPHLRPTPQYRNSQLAECDPPPPALPSSGGPFAPRVSPDNHTSEKPAIIRLRRRRRRPLAFDSPQLAFFFISIMFPTYDDGTAGCGPRPTPSTVSQAVCSVGGTRPAPRSISAAEVRPDPLRDYGVFFFLTCAICIYFWSDYKVLLRCVSSPLTCPPASPHPVISLFLNGTEASPLKFLTFVFSKGLSVLQW